MDNTNFHTYATAEVNPDGSFVTIIDTSGSKWFNEGIYTLTADPGFTAISDSTEIELVSAFTTYHQPFDSDTIEIKTDPIETTMLLYREIIYNDEGIGGIVTSTSNDSLYWSMVDSDGKAVVPYYQNLPRSGDMSKWSFKELNMSGYGRNSFEMTTNVFPPGEYAIVIFNENIEIKKNFTIMDKCCRPLSVSIESGAYLPGERFQIYSQATPKTPLTFSLIDPNGKISKTKEITTNHQGKIQYESLSVPRIAIPGIWTLEVTDGKNLDSTPIIIISTPDELIKKSPSSEKILTSYENELANKKSGYEVLLASSLEPFEDDGRQYRHKILEHYPAPTLYYDMIKHGWIDTTGFETDKYGIVTYVDEPHEKYTLNSKKGFYLEDWIPDNIPDGQKLLYAQTNYSTYEKNELINEKYGASYNFVPINFVVDENTTTYDLKHNMGFRVIIHYNSWQDEIEDILEGQKERHTELMGNYGGYQTMMRDGEMMILFEGGYTGRHYENSIYWIFDDNYSIRVSSHYYTLDELLPIFDSIMKESK